MTGLSIITPLPDPTVIVTWPQAAVAIAIILAAAVAQGFNLWVSLQTRVQAGKTTAITEKLDKHIEDDAAWKALIEQRLPAAEPATDAA